LYYKTKSLRRLFILFLLSITATGFSQNVKPQNDPAYDFKKLHFGFTIGLNTMDFTVHPSPTGYNSSDSYYFADVPKLDPGFHVGIVSNLRLAEYFDLRFLPGISFGQRNIKFYKKVGNIWVSYNQSPQILESSYIELPLLIKYKAKRINNYRPYLLGGANMRMDMAARKSYDESKNIYLRLNRYGIYAETGFGIDYYLKYFKFSTELKFSMGLNDMLVHEPAKDYPQYVNSISKLKSSLIMLSLHFE
jgi:hypothetical protein